MDSYREDNGSAVLIVILAAMLVVVALLVAAGGRAVLQQTKTESATDSAAHAGLTAAFDTANEIVPDQTEIDAAIKASEPPDPLAPEEPAEEVTPEVPEGRVPIAREQLVLRWMAVALGVGRLSPVEQAEFGGKLTELRSQMKPDADACAAWVISETIPYAGRRESRLWAESDYSISYEIRIGASMSTGASQADSGLGETVHVANDVVTADAEARATIFPR